MLSVTRAHSYPPSGLFQPQHYPWVSVICISYNQQDYVVQALQSVVTQCYPHVELIVIDNGSSDQSAARITQFIPCYPAIRFIRNPVNLGLNRAFNQGLALAGGEYIIDLSADDVLLADRITKQVACFKQKSGQYGVVFSNAAFIDARGRQTGVHFPVTASGQARVAVPSGDVFRSVLASYFICTPTMMMRRAMLTALGGYDEALSYEDFDLWVRSSRQYQYAYLDEILTLKRQHPHGLSAQVTRRNNNLLPSTLIVCQKALSLCTTPEEFEALASRLQRFIRKACYAEQAELVRQFDKLLRQIRPPDVLTSLFLLLNRLPLPVNRLYHIYLRRRFPARWRNCFRSFFV